MGHEENCNIKNKPSDVRDEGSGEAMPKKIIIIDDIANEKESALDEQSRKAEKTHQDDGHRQEITSRRLRNWKRRFKCILCCGGYQRNKVSFLQHILTVSLDLR